ncbi:MAG TPA: hypothetical protein VLS28_08570 [Candidatus Sulfomarinibacteraceae bacterium]|nr:hypothetical protein [Candidatus Sulfomarinibacteraceae bacterium]
MSFIGGAFAVLGGLGALGLGAFVSAVTGIGGLFQILGIVALALGVAELAIGYGFWTLKPWAWSLAFVVFVVSILIEILRFLSWGGYGFTSIAVSIAITALIVYYMNQANVRQAFGAPANGFPIIGNALDKYLPGNK